MIRFGAEICANFTESSRREWLETNGVGGFASGTISGVNTRRYHGLLTAATHPPLGRITMLSKFEETLIIDGRSYELSANQYPDSVYPEGYKYLKSFALNPFPVWTFEIEGIEIEKSVFMIHGENSTVIQFKPKVQSPKSKVELRLRPLLSFSDYHGLQHESADFNRSFESSENSVSVQPFAELPPLFFSHNARRIETTGFWYKNFEYAVERTRGFDFREDLFQPFALVLDLSADADVIASTEKRAASDAEKFRRAEIGRRENLVKQAAAEDDDFTKQLVLAAEQFVVARGAGQTIIAGYPWFSDWGRDTMIALPGLALATNRADIAKNIILEFSKHISEGMIPNRFPDAGEVPEYNTADATLWYFEAVRAYVEKTGDLDFVKEMLYEKLANIIEWHLHGTRYRIRVDTDGLLCAGTPDVQLTWMDAKINGFVVTPRTGKPVEIQALWYNALCVMADFAARFDDADGQSQYRAMAQTAKLSFNGLFWNADEQCLFDAVENGTRDASVRPNQIFAASLHYPILDAEKRAKVLEKVQTELLTPVGLRSLSAKDEKYCPVYQGSPFERDSCYHQGTVWAWLIGAFVDAYRLVHAGEEDLETRVGEILAGFKTHLLEDGIGQISEIFDADAPHAPRGCFAQAWSVAEILRVLNPVNDKIASER